MTISQIIATIFTPFGLFLFGVFVRYFIKLVDDVGAIKTYCEVQTEKHNNLEHRVTKIENQLEEA